MAEINIGIDPKTMVRKIPIVCVSGGFDPLHKGHVRLIKEASKFGEVFIILNSDEWLKRKKDYHVMSWDDRAEILMAIKGVKAVVAVDDADGTVCKALEQIKPNFFANGGDRKENNTPEVQTCAQNNIQMLWGIGGEKIASSQEIINAI